MKYSFEEKIIGRCDGGKGQGELRRNFLDVAFENCGFNNRNPRFFEVWCNKKAEVFLDWKGELFEVCNKCGAHANIWHYCETKKVAKRIVAKAIDGAERAFKVYLMVLDDRRCNIVDSDKMLYVFILGRGTVVHLSENRKLFYVFVDLEKAFDLVPREAI